MSRAGNPWTFTELRDMVAQVKMGASLQDLSDASGRTPSAIRKALRRYTGESVLAIQKENREVERTDILNKVSRGELTDTEAAKLLGVKRGQVVRLARELGYPLFYSGGRRCWTTRDALSVYVLRSEPNNLTYKQISARLGIPHTSVRRLYRQYIEVMKTFSK